LRKPSEVRGRGGERFSKGKANQEAEKQGQTAFREVHIEGAASSEGPPGQSGDGDNGDRGSIAVRGGQERAAARAHSRPGEQSPHYGFTLQNPAKPKRTGSAHLNPRH